MCYRNDVHLLCSHSIGSELIAATANAPDGCRPHIKNGLNTIYLFWDFVVWDRYICDWCKDVYDILQKYDDSHIEGYKLIRIGEALIDIEEEMNDFGEMHFNEDFYVVRTVNLGTDFVSL